MVAVGNCLEFLVAKLLALPHLALLLIPLVVISCSALSLVISTVSPLIVQVYQ